jgi:lysophospholipid acyltransferase (LPLAT)-like uncharacterized protein
MRRDCAARRGAPQADAGSIHYTSPVTADSKANPAEAKPALEPAQPDPPRRSVAQRLGLVVVPPLAALLIRLLGLTLRYEDRAEPGVTPGYAIPGPTVFAFWHRSLLACAHRFRNLDIAILISPSFDGELIARTVELLGFKAIRGSSSRGGAAGLRNMQIAYAEGHRCAFTADGPRGPVFVAKPGATQLASSVGGSGADGGPSRMPPLGTWVGCFYALPGRAWQLRSWDRFLIPKPFSRVVLTWPAHIPAGEVTTAAVQAALDRAVQMAVDGN